MNIEAVRAYLELHFGPHRANGTLGVKKIQLINTTIFYISSFATFVFKVFYSNQSH